jgi:hypothetical protein
LTTRSLRPSIDRALPMGLSGGDGGGFQTA